MLTYSTNVLRSYIRQHLDGTLWSLKKLDEEGHRLQSLYGTQASGFLQIIPKDTITRTVHDYKALVHDQAQWDAFEPLRLDPCFRRVPDFHPFEKPGTHLSLEHANDETVHATADTWFEEAAISPDTIIRLSLSKIEHRFPSAEDDLPGDGDIRGLISAQTHVFQFNYRHLNQRRLTNVRGFMRTAQVIQALWTVWFLEHCAGNEGFRPLHAGLAVLGINPEGANPILTVLGNPVAFAVITATIYVTLLTTADYFHGLQRQRFAAFTRASSATVSKSVTTRQDNLVYLTRAMLEEIDRGKEEAWDQNKLKAWAGETQKWAKLVFWCDQRIEANEEHLRINMKLVGLAYVGIRAEARFKALQLIAGHLLLAVLLGAGIWYLGQNMLGWHVRANAGGNFPLGAGCYAAVTTGFIALLVWLHSLIRAIDPPQSVNDMVQWASTTYMKGYRDSALYREVAEFITRDKRRLLHEEEKRRLA